MQTLTKLVTLLFLSLLTSCTADKEASKTVQSEGRIFDKANLLTESQEDSVFQLIGNLENDIGSQIAVLTIDSLGNEQIEEFSLRKALELRLGRSTHNDGILVTIAFHDRKARIEVGTGLENIIKDEIAARLLRDDLAPKFREQKYGQGIYVTVDKLSKLIRDNAHLVGTDPLSK